MCKWNWIGKQASFRIAIFMPHTSHSISLSSFRPFPNPILNVIAIFAYWKCTHDWCHIWINSANILVQLIFTMLIQLIAQLVVIYVLQNVLSDFSTFFGRDKIFDVSRCFYVTAFCSAMIDLLAVLRWNLEKKYFLSTMLKKKESQFYFRIHSNDVVFISLTLI